MRDRIAPFLIPATALIAGIGIGWLLHMPPLPRSQPPVTPQPTPTAPAPPYGQAAKLGEELLGRVGRRLVAMQGEPERKLGVTFYDTPKPYGYVLCRVNAYSVPKKVMTGLYPASGQYFWEDDLEVSRRYVVWTSPTGPRRSVDEQLRACAAYRDFDHSFVEDTLNTAERAATLLAMVIAWAQSRAPSSFPVSCTETMKDPTSPKPCDGRARLRGWSLKQLTQVTSLSEQLDPVRQNEDRLILSLSGWRTSAAIVIASTDQKTIRSVRISIDTIPCGC